MSDVGSWQPNVELNEARLELLTRAASAIDEPDLGLDAAERDSLQGVMQLDFERWRDAAGNAEAADIIGWIKVTTLLEERFPGFEAGARSPVIALVAHLRAVDAYPDDLTQWIKAHTRNRFLPYGSLLDRL